MRPPLPSPFQCAHTQRAPPPPHTLPVPKDVQQGSIGDCYFVAELANLAQTPLLLDASIVTTEANEEGVYCVRFFIRGAWRHVFVDGLLPSHPSNYRLPHEGAQSTFTVLHSSYVGVSPEQARYAVPMGAHSTSMPEMWPALLEKAFARLLGSYGALEAHFSGPLAEGAPSHQSKNAPFSLFSDAAVPGYQRAVEGGPPADALWAELCACARLRWPATLGSSSGAWFKRAQGLVRDHAFTVLQARPLPLSGGGELRLVQLRNPHACGEWTGKFSDKDAASWTPELRAATGYSPDASAWDDGVFWMAWPDVVANFQCLTVTPLLLPADSGGAWHVERLAATRGDPPPFTVSPTVDGQVFLLALETSGDAFFEPHTSGVPSSALPAPLAGACFTRASGAAPLFVELRNACPAVFASQAPFTVDLPPEGGVVFRPRRVHQGPPSACVGAPLLSQPPPRPPLGSAPLMSLPPPRHQQPPQAADALSPLQRVAAASSRLLGSQVQPDGGAPPQGPPPAAPKRNTPFNRAPTEDATVTINPLIHAR
jgi:hypothetical protein